MLAFFLVFERARVMIGLGTPSVHRGWTLCAACSFIVLTRSCA